MNFPNKPTPNLFMSSHSRSPSGVSNKNTTEAQLNS